MSTETKEASPYLNKLDMNGWNKKKPLQAKALTESLSFFKGKTEKLVSSDIKRVSSKKDKSEYASVEVLRDFINQLQGHKFKLDCGHHVTFGYFLGNDIVIKNGKELEIVCRDCWS